ncbi:MAG: hypothetical protein H0T73_19810 [Ardenticatenales bacterium]|nr:hypothetical protein [Ardenticatenales bacterium]
MDPARGVGAKAHLAVDPAGQLHVAYLDRSAPAVKYALRDATGRHLDVIEVGNAYVGGIDLVLDAQGQPHISYSVAEEQWVVKYATPTSRRWQSRPCNFLTLKPR